MIMIVRSTAVVAVVTLLALPASPRRTQTGNADDLTVVVDSAANDVLAATGVPSASVAVVMNGQVVYLKAYGNARLDPLTAAATASMRYSVGSISKQFTASAVLMLQEQGKLSLDDTVGKYVPELTRGNDVTIRQILSHTSGYQDLLAAGLRDAARC